MGERVISTRKPWQRLIRRAPLVVWLTLVWIMLWGRLDAGTVLFGLLIAVLITTMFPVPPITTDIVLRPLRLAELVAYLGWDLVISTFRVAWQSLWHRGRAKAGIVAVRLKTDSDHIIAMVANAVSLAPGTFVLQIDRGNRICYVYQLGMAEQDAAEVRRHVLGLEARVVRAVGSRTNIAIVESEGSAG